MSTKVEKNKKGVKITELHYGEAYRTTKKFTWSNYDGGMAKIDVPADELLIFRCTQAYKGRTELALFFWLEKRITICLAATEKSILYVKHMDWIERHRSLKISEREDDTEQIKMELPNEVKGQSNPNTSGRKPVDS